MHPLESFECSGGDKMYPKSHTMALVYDIRDDRVHDASEMFREWKSSKCMDKDTITPYQFNAGYEKGYKEWMKKDIQNISFQTPRSFRSLTNK